MLVGATPMIPVGLTLGIYGGGALLNGNGGVGWTILGELSGGLVSLIGATMIAGTDPPAMLAILAIGLPPLMGGILGYELSHDDPADEPTAQGPARMIVTIAPIAEGAMVAVAGTL